MSGNVFQMTARPRPANFLNLGPDEYHGTVLSLEPNPASMPAWAAPIVWLGRSKPSTNGLKQVVFEPSPTVDTMIIILRADPRWAGVLGYDRFAARLVFRRPPPWGESLRWGESFTPGVEWTDEDADRLVGWLNRAYRIRTIPKIAHSAAMVVGEQNGFNDLQDYLVGLKWDGVSRCSQWLQRVYGAEDTPLNRSFGSMWLISAVARAMHPGEKVDTCLILEGGQGIGKSSSLQNLAGKKFFTTIHGDVDHKDTLQLIRGVWIGELAEMSTMRRSDVDSMKRFLATPFDRYRESYGRFTKTYLRGCVFVATTNKDRYLQDDTGARRFWPVRCGSRVDQDYILGFRDQLWAESMAHYRDPSVRWWLDGEDGLRAAEAAESRYEADVLEESVHPYLVGRDRATMSDIMTHLGYELHRRPQSDQNRIGKILRMHGWVVGREQVGGLRESIWRPKTPKTTKTPKTPEFTEPTSSTADSFR